jgi:hypothetical protein
MRRIESMMACLFLLALVLASARSTAWSQEDLLSQQRAISAIKRVGGVVERYEDSSGTRGLSVRFAPVIRPPDLSATGIDSQALIDSELRHLQSVPHLKRLSLQVDWVRISGAGLEHVRGLNELQSLDILYSPRGIARARGDEPRISGLKYVRGLERLKSLHIALYDQSGAALREIRDLPRLEGLSLIGFQVTDADLEFLLGLKSLKYLSLTSPRVTDKALVRVQELAHLKVLSLEQCPKLTEKGIKGLRHSLPRTRIYAPS